ncbi:MAG: glycerate kinase, partial [Solirubrobacterales bacterium]
HGAQLLPGADFVLDALDFDSRLARADAVISGEGRFDSQSLEGKIVGAVGARCADAGKPLHLIIGENALRSNLPALVSSVSTASTLEELQRAGAGVLLLPLS